MFWTANTLFQHNSKRAYTYYIVYLCSFQVNKYLKGVFLWEKEEMVKEVFTTLKS